jgi:hypothetical protein
MYRTDEIFSCFLLMTVLVAGKAEGRDWPIYVRLRGAEKCD